MATKTQTKDMATTEYSKYSYVIRGEGTRAVKGKLMKANCKWNNRLKGGAGWIVSKKSFKKVQSFVPTPTDVKKPVTVVDEDSDSDSDSDSEIDYKALYEKEQEDHRCSKMGFKIRIKSLRRMNKAKIKELQDKDMTSLSNLRHSLVRIETLSRQNRFLMTNTPIDEIDETIDKTEIRDVMSDLDDKKETIQEGLYLKLSNLLMKFYNK